MRQAWKSRARARAARTRVPARPREPLPFRSAHALLDEVTDATIDRILAIADERLVMVQLRHMGGALARVEPGAGARAALPGEISLLRSRSPRTPRRTRRAGRPSPS